MASKPNCTVANCKACEQALIFYEKVYDKLHAVAKLPISQTSQKQPEQSENQPQITGVYNRVKGQIISHEIQQTTAKDNTANHGRQQLFENKTSLDPEVLLPADIFPRKIASKPTGQHQVRFEPYSFSPKAKENKGQFKYEWLPKIQLGQGLGGRDDAKKQKERQHHFEELRKCKQTAWWYCFHKMSPQRTTPCCKQCFRLAEV
jgi:pterin-4a-carbinolamine dehydratase